MFPQRLPALVLVLSIAMPARAAAAGRPEDDSTANTPALGVTAKPSVEAQIVELRDALTAQIASSRAQERRIAALESDLRAARAGMATEAHAEEIPANIAPQPPSPTATNVSSTRGTPQLDQKIESLSAEVSSMKKSFGERLKNIGPFSFSGDIRLRDELFFGGPADQSQVRNRERFRLRLNGAARYEDFSGGFTFATGDVNNPVSTNQTLNQFYTRKPFDLDRAYIEYRPHYFRPLTLTGGKFVYPWVSTELTWDKDLSPDGLAQTISFDLESLPLRRVALVRFELPFAETAGVSLNTIASKRFISPTETSNSASPDYSAGRWSPPPALLKKTS